MKIKHDKITKFNVVFNLKRGALEEKVLWPKFNVFLARKKWVKE